MEEVVGRAFATAVQGRAGPVVVALPEDMLREATQAAVRAPAPVARAAPPAAFLESLTERLAKTERPLMILGGSGWTSNTAAALADWAGRVGLPIALSFRRKDLIDNRHTAYAGDLGIGPNPRLVERVRSADLIIAIGARLGENPTQGYCLFAPIETAEKLVHVHADPAELGRVWPASLTACADAALAAEAL